MSDINTYNSPQRLSGAVDFYMPKEVCHMK